MITNCILALVRHRLGAAALLLGLLLVAGCGGPTLGTVSGTVLMDDQPLAEGEIIFESIDQSQTPAASKITDGKYSLEVAAGMKKVRILASRPMSKPDPVMGSAARESALGPEYNEKSDITYEVKPGKNIDVDFQVKQLPKGK